jgi:hypothetical protein
MLLRWTSVGCAVRTGDRARRDAGPAQPGQSHFDAAFLRFARAFVNGAPADLVPVFRQVGQVAEIGEGTDHAHRLPGRERLEQALERLVRLRVGIAAEGDRELADPFHQFESRHAFLFPDHVAQDPAEQPDVFDQRTIVVARTPLGRVRLQGWHGWGFLAVLK